MKTWIAGLLLALSVGAVSGEDTYWYRDSRPSVDSEGRTRYGPLGLPAPAYNEQRWKEKARRAREIGARNGYQYEVWRETNDPQPADISRWQETPSIKMPTRPKTPWWNMLTVIGVAPKDWGDALLQCNR